MLRPIIQPVKWEYMTKIATVFLVLAFLLAPLNIVGAQAHVKPDAIRFATFNASLNRDNAGDLRTELAVPGSDQPDTVAEIIQRTRPDVLLINEFDFDPAALMNFQANYLSVAHGDAAPIMYPYTYFFIV